jgi:DNA-binding YbaB/EbfC family protein
MNIQALMQQAKTMQKNLDKKLEEFHKKSFEYNYKNDSIVIIISGKCMIQDIKINKILIDPDDETTLQEMVAEAVNAAIIGVKQDEDAIRAEMTPSGI